MSKAEQRSWICVDSDTLKRCGRSLSVGARGGLIVVTTSDPAACEWGGSAYLPSGAAAHAGLALLAEAFALMPPEKVTEIAEKMERDAQEAQLRAAGWLPAADDQEGAQEDDWTPPEDRSNLWEFERALAEMRRRA